MKLPTYQVLKISAENRTTIKAEWLQPLVLCENCIFSERHEDETTLHCNYPWAMVEQGLFVEPNDFCSNGVERGTVDVQFHEEPLSDDEFYSMIKCENAPIKEGDANSKFYHI